MLAKFFLVVAVVGMYINILTLYKSLKIIKSNERVVKNKLDVKLYKEPINFRFFYIVIIFHLIVWSYSTYAFDLDNLPQTIQKLVWMNDNILLVMFAMFSIGYFVFGGKYWQDPIRNHSKITFRVFGVAVSFALTMSVHFVIYFVEFKLL